MGKHTKSADVVLRLAKVEGHIRGIKNMVEDHKSCADVLLQISAVEAALKKVKQIIFEDHLENCIEEVVQQGNTGETIDEIKKVVTNYLK
ncbi:MAG: metal-sensitive transcriptional regulator [Clostridia bacterium]|nr:metal-sensitive transcriptional regulator [Clostridia bacterium]